MASSLTATAPAAVTQEPTRPPYASMWERGELAALAALPSATATKILRALEHAAEMALETRDVDHFFTYRDSAQELHAELQYRERTAGGAE